MGSLLKINSKDARSVSLNCELSEAATIGLRTHVSAVSYLQFLIENELYTDAVKFLANGLPAREAIWWAYRCVLGAEQGSATEETLHVLSIVERWVYQPDESTRRAAEKAANRLEFKTPASWVAMAVFWSGGSIAPADNPEVLLASHYVGKAVAGAIMLAAAMAKPEKIQESYQYYLSCGIHIANGGDGELNGTTSSTTY